MPFIRCSLPHPLHLVLPERCLQTAAKNYPGITFPKTIAEVEEDLLIYAESGLLTLVDDRQPDKLRISFCTSQYELLCSLTQDLDAYFALSMTPIALRTHNQIARGAVLLIPQTWGLFEDLPDLNRQVSQPGQTGLESILAAWKQTRQPARTDQQQAALLPATGTSSDELSFLANIDTLIDLACQVELEQASRQQRTPVKSVEAASTTRGEAWRFQLAAPAGFRAGEFIQTGAGEFGPKHDGVVLEASGPSLLVRFYQPVELKTLQRVEWLTPRISTRQYTIQHAAVNALRNGDSLNPRLLPLLVENRFEPYNAPSITSGDGRPNPAQKTLIERALLVPDLLLALGPPGTGKTDTIREIVARQAALGRKVLVTSRNHKAVDNVLEGLKNVQALRIGREEAVSPEVRPLLIDNLAGAMQDSILESIRPVQHSLEAVQERWPQVQQSIDQLAQFVVDWRQAQAAVQREQEVFNAWQNATHALVEPVLARQEQHRQLVEARLAQATRDMAVLRQRLAALRRFSRAPLIGSFITRLAGQLESDLQAITQQHASDELDARKSAGNQRRITDAYRQYVNSSAQALEHKRPVAAAEEKLTATRAGINLALEELARLSEPFGDRPGMLADFPTPAALESALWQWRGWYELTMRRRGLLLEWRKLLQTSQQALYPALIRGAEVVGATCIGIATDARFEDLEFDLVIADEAGQIQVMDLLVPLVRARRAVLVGDHLQLPPLVEPEITLKIRENEPENQELGEWLEKSLFERLIQRPGTPASNRVMLDTQYRMPRQIADFISTQFYSGNYHTGNDLPHTDAFFSGSPLVFIDTMREFRHSEMRADDGQGYTNAREAGLVCDLLLAYQAKNVQPGVIVPYKKQAELIRRELRKRLPGVSDDELLSRVATVDSFQGREQDVIIFSFTRSNTEGRIGFLSELRRLNVSLTRARRQLLLVGDSVTLSGAADPDFARLVKALLESAKTTPKGYLYASDLARQLQS